MTAAGALPTEVDVLVVGAGPAGSAAAARLAAAGLSVLVCEKAVFPREKVCGDGLTPRAVRMLHELGVDTSVGWQPNLGLRIVGGGRAVEVPWPAVPGYPAHGLTRTRADLDTLLADRARELGADVRHGVTVTAPVRDDRAGRVVGVRVRPGRAGEPQVIRSRVVVAADGGSSRTALAVGRHRRRDRPLGVAVRAYHRSARHDDPWLTTWLEVPAPGTGRLLPGYGWAFGLGDGTVNVGIGLLDAAAAPGLDHRALLDAWLAGLPAEWDLGPGTREGAVGGAALPMGLNRCPHYADGLLLVGDAGGLVNPTNGEGIAYALESGVLAGAVVAEALGRPGATAREAVLRGYPDALAATYGGYYTLGRWFLRALRQPRVMALGARHGTHHPRALGATVRVLSNLTDPDAGGAVDRSLARLTRVLPTA